MSYFAVSRGPSIVCGNPTENLVQALNCRSLKDVIAAIWAKADVSVVDNTGSTLLHYAAFWGEYEICVALVLGGAKIDCLNLNGFTPIDLAHQAGWYAVASYLETSLAYAIPRAAVTIPDYSMPALKRDSSFNVDCPWSYDVGPIITG